MKNLFKFIAGLALFAALFSVYGYGQANIALGSQVSGGSVLAAPAGSVPVGGPGLSTDYALAAWNGVGGNLLRNTTIITDANGDLSFPNSATNGIRLFNNAVIGTNDEFLQLVWSANSAIIQTNITAGGTPRNLVLRSFNAASANAPIITLNGTSGNPPLITFSHSQNGNTAASGVFVFTGTRDSTGNTGGYVAITPTYNQTSTAAATDLLINRTQTAVGSGAQRLIDAQVGGTSQFSVVNNGHVLLGGLSTDGTGVLQLPVATTSAGGISFGAINLFQASSAGNGALSLSAGQFTLSTSGSTQVFTGNGNIVSNSGGSLTFKTSDGATTALTLDASQNATLAHKLTLNATGGTTTADGLFFGTDITLYRSAANAVSLTNGSESIVFSSSLFGNPNTGRANINASNTTSGPSFTFAGDAATGMYRSAASTLVLASGATTLTLDSSQNATFAGNVTVPKRLITTPSALTYSSPTSVDVSLGSCFTVTTVNATGSVTFNATAGGTAGQEMTILITNDATSAKTITFGTNFLTTGTLTASGVSRHTSITFKSDGTSWYETGRAVLTN